VVTVQVARDQSALPSGQWSVAGGQLPEKDVRGNSSAWKWPVVSGFTSGQWLVAGGQLPESELARGRLPVVRQLLEEFGMLRQGGDRATKPIDRIRLPRRASQDIAAEVVAWHAQYQLKHRQCFPARKT
jgi:hypothetical protein